MQEQSFRPEPSLEKLRAQETGPVCSQTLLDAPAAGPAAAPTGCLASSRFLMTLKACVCVCVWSQLLK